MTVEKEQLGKLQEWPVEASHHEKEKKRKEKSKKEKGKKKKGRKRAKKEKELQLCSWTMVKKQSRDHLFF